MKLLSRRKALRRLKPLKRTPFRPKPPAEPLPPEVWDEVERRDRECQASVYGLGSTAPCWGPPVVHHRRRRRGQPDVHDPAYLVLLCDRHHREVHDYPTRAYSCGLLLRSGKEPA